MKKMSLCSVLLLVCAMFPTWGQDSKTPQNKSSSISISKMNATVSIHGNLATTTLELSLYNNSTETLEESIDFPLPAEARVTRFALEVNGQLKDASYTSRETGRIALEAVIRRKIDPALLEKGTGNNYKARVYPLFPKKTKRVLLEYIEPLEEQDTGLYYQLPFAFAEKIPEFHITFTCIDATKQPKETTKDAPWENQFRLSKTYKDSLLDGSYSIAIPVSPTKKTLHTEDYFYSYIPIPKATKKREKPETIQILWDASLSMQDRNLQKEIEVLNAYFKALQNVEVTLAIFQGNITTNHRFTIQNGQWQNLQRTLENIPYDGASSFPNCSNLQHPTLLFSDGKFNSSAKVLPSNSQPIFCISSTNSQNSSVLEEIANKSKGDYLSLVSESTSTALFALNHYKKHVFSIHSENPLVDVRAVKTYNIKNAIQLIGSNYHEDACIDIQYGSEEKDLETISIHLEDKESTNRIDSYWAYKELESLQNQKDLQNQLCERFKLVSDFSSLIVLELDRDYQQFGIKNNNNNNVERLLTRELMDIVEDSVVAEESIVAEEIIEDVPFTMIEQVPIFPGCTGTNQALKSCFETKVREHVTVYFNKNIADSLGLTSGKYKIISVFKIDSNGKITDTNARAPHPALKREALRVLALLPDMIPGKQNGRNVSVPYMVPITIQVGDGSESLELRNPPTPPSRNRQRSNRPVIKSPKPKSSVVVKEPYIKAFANLKNSKDAYKKYLQLRKEYYQDLDFYHSIAMLFETKYKDTTRAQLIYSNILELDMDDYENRRMYAYFLEKLEEREATVYQYETILALRTEDMQSYRDLALAYQYNGQCQLALDTFWHAYSQFSDENAHRRNIKGMYPILKKEIQQLIEKERENLDLSEIPDTFFKDSTDYDLRVVVDWNHNDTDIDLHITNPAGETCSYRNSTTKEGGQMSKDMTAGFGPEEYTCSKTLKGEYSISINYYDDNYQKDKKPCAVKVTVFRNYGSASEEKEVYNLSLNKRKEWPQITSISF